MSLFRRSKQRAGTPTPTPTPPAELVQDLTSRRDSRALAALSATIALSVGSAFDDTRGTTSDDTTVQGVDVMGQTAYSAVRMAVEVVKESFDLAATSVAVSLNRNLMAQTKDSVQIFSLDVLNSGEARNQVCMSHVYPLGESHIISLVQSTRSLALLKLETLRELRPEDDTSSLKSLLADQSPSARSSFGRGPAAELGVSVVMEAWRSGTPLPEWTESTNEDGPLSGLSPEHTRIITVYNSPRRELRVKDATDGTALAKLHLDDDLAAGEVYALTFDSETRFYLKIDGPGQHVQIPYDIAASPSGGYSHTITRGKPVPSPKSREKPSYTLDVNFEWVLDAKSGKVCWIPPGNVRRGSGGHFWVGLSLVMVGDDGVVRKLSFKEPDC